MTRPKYSILQGDVRDVCRRLEAGSVHCVVTSPPYWGLRDYGVPGQMGLEPTPEEYVATQVEVFREVKRVLRDDGTLWLNLGDTWHSAKGQSGGIDPKQPARRHGLRPNDRPIGGLKPKDLVGIPWRVAFALQADGWYLRDCIIWHKTNPMPGSMRDRTCTSHEYIFLLSKSRTYFFDQLAISEPATMKARTVMTTPYKAADTQSMGAAVNRHMEANGGRYFPETRNPRSVWRISSRSYKEAHFATFPEALPARCIKAGTSEHGVCSVCGAPWIRETKKNRVATRPGTNSKVKVPSGWQTGPGSHDALTGRFKSESQITDERGPNVVGNRDPQRHITRIETVGWNAGCACGADTTNAVVFDPFNGAGTTGLAALRLGRDYVGSELNPDYITMTHERFKCFTGMLF